MKCVSISGDVSFQTSDATPTPQVIFGTNVDSGIAGRLLIVARRVSDGAQKCWDISATMRKQGDNPVELLNSINTTPFGAAADLTALSAVSISFFNSGDNIGFTATGLAGTLINWCGSFEGRQILDNVS